MNWMRVECCHIAHRLDSGHDNGNDEKSSGKLNDFTMHLNHVWIEWAIHRKWRFFFIWSQLTPWNFRSLVFQLLSLSSCISHVKSEKRWTRVYTEHSVKFEVGIVRVNFYYDFGVNIVNALRWSVVCHVAFVGPHSQCYYHKCAIWMCTFDTLFECYTWSGIKMSIEQVCE